MSQKRKLEEYHDPDYLKFPESKKSFFATDSDISQEEKIRKMSIIIKKEFQQERKSRQCDILEIDNRITLVKKLLHKIRYSVVLHYYHNKNLTLNSAGEINHLTIFKNDPPINTQNAIHPSLKKILGANMKDYDELLKIRPARQAAKAAQTRIKEKLKSKKEKRLERLKQQALLKIDLSNSPSSDRYKQTHIANVSKYISKWESPIVKLNYARGLNQTRHIIVVGNTSKYVAPIENLSSDNVTHKWLIYVQTKMDNSDPIENLIHKVRFFLHPSYKPNDIIDVNCPPFQLSRRGWGEFPVRLQLFFHSKLQQKPVQLVHNLVLDKKLSGLQTMGKIPIRFNVAVMLFMATLISYVMRVNFSFTIVAMVESTKTNSTEIKPDYGTRYSWSERDQGLLLSSFFYGYLLTSLPGGILADRFGGKPVVGYAMFASSILTALTPLAAAWNIWVVWILRFLIGSLCGFVFPSCHNLISKWAPPDEKGKFVAALMGSTFGTVITWPICSIIVEHLGWTWTFYITGAFCAFTTLIWFILVGNNPSSHRFIDPEERKYIEDSLGSNLAKKSRLPPFLSVLTSLPFMALNLLHFGNMWGFLFLQIETPKFLNEVLKFHLRSAGFVSVLPHITRMTMGFVFGSIVDFIRGRNLMNVTLIRKSFCLFSHVLPGMLLFVLAYYGDNKEGCIAILTLSLGFNGAAAVTNLQNTQDLAPNFAGTLYGAMNILGTLPGFFSPMLVAYFIRDNNTMNEWKIIFMIGGAVYIIPAIIFCIFGSGEVQKWNSLKEEEESK